MFARKFPPCTFIDLPENFHPARLFRPARLMFSKNFPSYTFILPYTSIRHTRVVPICPHSLQSRSSRFPRIGILAEYESSMFLHKVSQYLSSIFRKVPQFMRYLFLLTNNIGSKVVYFAPVIFCLIYNMNNYHAATFSLTSNTLTTFNVNSKCLEEKNSQNKLGN